jgi:predicted acetyltransferase
MNIELMPVSIDKKDILNNLLEKYNYEFSQYDKIPFNQNGLYNYRYLDYYWTEEGRAAYFIVVDNNLAGFVMINKHPECDKPINWAIAEFFVSYNYRRCGVATTIMNEVFKIYKGYWHIKYHPKNIASEIFWTKTANKASNGNYEIIKGNEDYFDGTEAKVLFFKTELT